MLKLRAHVIIAEFLLDIVDCVSESQKCLLDITVIIGFPAVHQNVHMGCFLSSICLLSSIYAFWRACNPQLFHRAVRAILIRKESILRRSV